MKFQATLFISAFLACSIFAQTDSVKAEIIKDFHKMGSNYYAYPTPEAKYTKVPAGYKPFYLSHYGRHGSRFHQPADHYHELYNTLTKADSAGKLTELGKNLLERAKYLDEYAAPRAGDLTQLGVAQHQGIAKRMVKNFPEVFKNDAYIEAYASTSVRCVVSMAAFLEELRAQKPKLDIHQESGKYLMNFISPLDFGKIIGESNTPAWQKENEKLYSHVDPTRMMRAIFNDTNYIKKKVNAGDLYSKIYEIGNSLQGSPEIEFNFDDLWTAEDMFERWRAQNAWWYSVLGNNPFAKKQGLENARPLLKNSLKCRQGNRSRYGKGRQDHSKERSEENFRDAPLWPRHRHLPVRRPVATGKRFAKHRHRNRRHGKPAQGLARLRNQPDGRKRTIYILQVQQEGLPDFGEGDA
jgi:Histidine acid phosphatase.